MKKYVMMSVLMAASGAFAQSSAGRDAFLKQQALAEVQRVTAQIDVLQTNQDDLSGRISKVEQMRGEIDSLKAEIAALKASVETLRSEVRSQRGQIVDDLAKKIAAIQPAPQKTLKSDESGVSYSGPCVEYAVQSGDSLYLIAQAFNTTVAKIKAVNGMKTDRIVVGQKIKVPKEY